MIQCNFCQVSNRQEANFCKQCGNLLAQTCPRCGFELPDESTYCDHCGLRLVDPPGFDWWAKDSPGASRPVNISEGSQLLALRSPIQRPEKSFPSSSERPNNIPQRVIQKDSSVSMDSRLHQYIPKALLEKLEAARESGTMAGERRVVTMLFCDVKGSTAAAEQLDPEEWTDIINEAFEHMIRPVYMYEGTVAHMMGDGLLAFFGAPIAHEDDPQRAVLAGLDIISSIKPYREKIKQGYGVDIGVRVGINTGLVVVGAVGSDLRMEYSAFGDAINLAARMEQTAAPGSVQIAQDTYRLVSSLFEFEELGGIEVKGKSEPVLAYRVLERKVIGTRRRGIEGLHAEMVGRKSEMQNLERVVSDLKQGVGRIVCLLGEAGLGKSRLASETHQVFKEMVGTDGNWYETTSLSYETNQAYGLFQRLIRRVAGIAYDAPAPIIREKLAILIESLSEARRSRATQLFEALFGLESENSVPALEGETFRRELLAVMSEWWQTTFSKKPTVLVFDDMHWSDAASMELLRQLLPLTGEMPLVLLCALRSERQSPAWKIKMVADADYPHRYTEIYLHPLSEAESNELVNRLLINAELPDKLRTNILEKAVGNPFFIEEVVRTLIDSGVVVSRERIIDGETQQYWKAASEEVDFAIPDNLQSLLAARMDLLEEETRGTLQVASVIGRSFYHRVLEAVDDASPGLDRRLGTLLKLDMIREAARLPEVEYAFRNPLTQEAVYQTILLKRRREFHRRVGEAMEALYPDRLEGLYGLLAYHFALAGQKEKAIHFSRQAAQQALELYAYDDALRNLRAALELIMPEERSEIHLTLLEELADVFYLLRDWGETISGYQKALELWSELDGADKLVEVRLHRKIVQVVAELKWSVGLETLQQANEVRETSRAALEKSLNYLESGPPQFETVHVMVALSTDAWRIQDPPDWEAAQCYAQSAVDTAEQLDSSVELSQALGALATVLDGRSLLREHLQIAEKRLAICREPHFEDIREQLEAVRSYGMALMFVGEYEQAMPYLKEAEELAAQSQVVDQQANALGLQGQCWFWLDRWDGVLETEEKWRDYERRYTRERVGET